MQYGIVLANKLSSLTWHSQLNIQKLNSIEPNPTQSVDWVQLSLAIEPNRSWNFARVRFPKQSNSITQIELNQTKKLCSIRFGNPTQSNTIQWIAFDCVQWINWPEQRLCYVVLKTRKTRVILKTLHASKNLLLIFSTSFTKNQEFRNQKYDWVWLSKYFCASLTWFPGGGGGHSLTWAIWGRAAG